MERRLIKRTRGLCPSCLEETDAELYEEGGRAVMDTLCPAHGRSSETADRDAEIYLRCASTRHNRPVRYGLVIPVSYACDLSCRWCYLPERGREFGADRIREMIAATPARHIVFSGGEPCLRRELPELIAHVRRAHPEKRSVLLTNGLRLADRSFAALLKDSGLDYCILSLNGFRPATHEFFNGRDLSAEKAAALRNLKALKVRTILSMTLARGVNEDELAAVVRFGLRNMDFVRQLRLRNVSDIGVHSPRERIYMSDLLRLVSSATGFTLEEMFGENAVSNRRGATVNYFVMNFFNVLRRRARTAAAPGPAFWLEAASRAGLAGALRMALEPEMPPEERTTFNLEIFSWPAAGGADLEEIRKFPIGHVSNRGEELPFWEALFGNDRERPRAAKGGEASRP
ncbi:MAG: radical SAM protein [Elusimicrobiales bacterium]|nr:radical SAM protein [Elusimicrobiales bacterium]